MARFTFRLPDIGEGIAEAEIVALHVAVGDKVVEDQPIADMMTDKATVEMESPVTGTVLEIGGDVGDVVAIGSTLVVIEVEGEDVADVSNKASEGPSAGGEEESTPITATKALPSTAAAEPSAAEPVTAPVIVSESHHTGEQRVLASPAVRARAVALGVVLTDVKPSADGRIRHADLDAFLRYGAAQGYAVPAATRADEMVKVVGMRRRIADNMAASKRAIPHFTYVDEIDVTALEAMRADLNANRGERPRLTLLPFLIVAICRALPDFPMMNARFDDDAGVVTRHGAVHMGIATQTPAGLMVPVVRDAHAKNIWQLSNIISELSEKARNGKAVSEGLSGSTLTITSLGPLGGLVTTPVINRPEVAIIGPNKIVERPVFDGDKIRKAKLMNLSISCDHRVIDGWDAANFVQAVKRLLETPVLLFAD